MQEDDIVNFTAEPIKTEEYLKQLSLKEAEELLIHMPHELGSALRFLMNRCDITCSQLSELSSVSERTIMSIRTSADKRPDISTLVKLCKALDIHPYISIKLIELSGQCFCGSISSLSLFDSLISGNFP